MTEALLGLTSGFSHGRGFSETLAPTAPAAGASSFTIPIGSANWERFGVLAFRLVSDSNAANRQVLLTVNGGDGVALFASGANAVQAASLTRDYFFVPEFNTPVGPVAGAYISPAPRMFLQSGFSLVVSIAAVQVGDVVSNIRWYPERFPTGPSGFGQGMVDAETLAEMTAQRVADLLS